MNTIPYLECSLGSWIMNIGSDKECCSGWIPRRLLAFEESQFRINAWGQGGGCAEVERVLRGSASCRPSPAVCVLCPALKHCVSSCCV